EEQSALSVDGRKQCLRDNVGHQFRHEVPSDNVFFTFVLEFDDGKVLAKFGARMYPHKVLSVRLPYRHGRKDLPHRHRFGERLTETRFSGAKGSAIWPVSAKALNLAASGLDIHLFSFDGRWIMVGIAHPDPAATFFMSAGQRRSSPPLGHPPPSRFSVTLSAVPRPPPFSLIGRRRSPARRGRASRGRPVPFSSVTPYPPRAVSSIGMSPAAKWSRTLRREPIQSRPALRAGMRPFANMWLIWRCRRRRSSSVRSSPNNSHTN